MVQLESVLSNQNLEDDSPDDSESDDDPDIGPQILVAGQRREERKREEEQCSHCGSKKHADLHCWKRLTCQKCNKKGHPTDRCYQAFKACGDIHAKGECKFEQIYNYLLQWYDPTKHAGLLPAQLEKLLN